MYFDCKKCAIIKIILFMLTIFKYFFYFYVIKINLYEVITFINPDSTKRPKVVLKSFKDIYSIKDNKTFLSRFLDDFWTRVLSGN